MTEEWFCNSKDTEDGSWCGPFDTKAEAVEEILADYEVGYVGRSGPLPYGPLISATNLLERLVCDVCGELSSEHPEYEDWLGGITKDQKNELEVALNATLTTWMTKHGYSLPTVILDVEKVKRT